MLPIRPAARHPVARQAWYWPARHTVPWSRLYSQAPDAQGPETHTLETKNPDISTPDTRASLGRYGAVVAGAGSAGAAIVGNLLDRGVRDKILWVDPAFGAGAIGKRWRDVTSNTKVKLFKDYAEGTDAFQAALARIPEPNAMTKLKELDQDRTCRLGLVADMLEDLTHGLAQHNGVELARGYVDSADLNGRIWVTELQIHSEPAGDKPPTVTRRTVSTKMLAMALGSNPVSKPLPFSGLSIRKLAIETALDRQLLREAFEAVAPAPNITVGVFGSSHTAVLVLLNLCELAQSPKSAVPNLKIKWFARSPLRYAEERDGWILRDNTGLKGVAADWAKANLEDDKLPTSDAGKMIEKIDLSEGKYAKACKEHLPQCTDLVQAIGFSPAKGPNITQQGLRILKKFDHCTGRFRKRSTDQHEREEIPGLFAAGIARPERVVDPEGNTEFAVGMWKFMKFLQRVTHIWMKATFPKRPVPHPERP